MNSTVVARTMAGPVRLPQWYAGWGAGEQGTSVSRASAIHVIDPQQDCQIHRFGRDGGSAILFEGYLFDRTDWCRDLQLPTTATNAEIAAAAFERWGPGVFDRLDGAYLLAIADREHGQLLLGHDAAGRHPVFYATVGRAVWFGSNILALAHSGRVATTPNRVSFALLMFLYWPEAGETYFSAIRRVRVGQFITFTTAGRESAHQYWHPIPPDDVPWLPDDQALDEFEPALDRAVARCLQLDPHGIMLSGGLDSVTIAGIAHAQRRAAGLPPIAAVCGRTGRQLSYEEVMQSRVADALGMPQAISTTPEWLGGRDAIELSLELTPALPAPSRIWWVGTYTGFYRRAAGAGLNVLLTGAGGDNWLGVANTHAADLLRSGRLGELVKFIRSDVSTAGISWRIALERRLWAGGVRTLLDSGAAAVAPGLKAWFHRVQWARHWPEWLCPDRQLRQEVTDRLVGRRTPALDERRRFPCNYYRHSLRTIASPYMHHETETGFHVAASCGLRLLSPYHDRRIVSFMNRIAPETLLLGGKYKGLLRPVARKYFPGFDLEKQRKEYAATDQQRAFAEFRTSLMRIWPEVSRGPLCEMGVVGEQLNGVVPGESSSTEDLAVAYAILSASRWADVHV